MTKTLSVRLDETRWQRLEATAAAKGVSESEIVRNLVDTLEAPGKTWEDILAPLQARATEIKAKDRRENPVLVARKQERESYANRLR